MKKDPIIFLEHIIDCIDKIELKMKDVSMEAFFEDYGIQDIVIRRISIIGEASANLPTDFKKKYSQINWKDIKAMRNILVHEYFGVRVKRVWETVQNDIPELKIKVLKILETEVKNKKLL